MYSPGWVVDALDNGIEGIFCFSDPTGVVLFFQLVYGFVLILVVQNQYHQRSSPDDMIWRCICLYWFWFCKINITKTRLQIIWFGGVTVCIDFSFCKVNTNMGHLQMMWFGDIHQYTFMYAKYNFHYISRRHVCIYKLCCISVFVMW